MAKEADGADVAEEGSDDADDAGRDVPADASHRRTVPFGAFVAAVLAAVALGILAIVALASGDGTAETATEGRDTTDARMAAARFADRFLTYSYDDMDAWRSGVAELATGGFAREVDSMQTSLTELLTSGEIRAQSQVTDVYISGIDGSSASVVVRYDRVITDSGGERLETNGYTRFDLVQADGGWLTEDVYSLVDPTPVTATPPPGDGPGSEPTDIDGPAEPDIDDE